VVDGLDFKNTETIHRNVRVKCTQMYNKINEDLEGSKNRVVWGKHDKHNTCLKQEYTVQNGTCGHIYIW
jgi:calcineurin-like phosphoesterase family protein